MQVPPDVGRLLDYLGIDWDDSVRRHAERARGRTIRTASYDR